MACCVWRTSGAKRRRLRGELSELDGPSKERVYEGKREQRSPRKVVVSLAPTAWWPGVATALRTVPIVLQLVEQRTHLVNIHCLCPSLSPQKVLCSSALSIYVTQDCQLDCVGPPPTGAKRGPTRSTTRRDASSPPAPTSHGSRLASRTRRGCVRMDESASDPARQGRGVPILVTASTE